MRESGFICRETKFDHASITHLVKTSQEEKLPMLLNKNMTDNPSPSGPLDIGIFIIPGFVHSFGYEGSSPLSSSLSRISALCLRVWILGSLQARACRALAQNVLGKYFVKKDLM